MKKSNNYDYLSQIETDLSGEIQDLKQISKKINSQLREECTCGVRLRKDKEHP
jgi:hypothetical protein